MLRAYENYWELTEDIGGENLVIAFGSFRDAEVYISSLGYIEKGMSNYFVKERNTENEKTSMILKKTLWRLQK